MANKYTRRARALHLGASSHRAGRSGVTASGGDDSEKRVVVISEEVGVGVELVVVGPRGLDVLLVHLRMLLRRD